MQQMNFPNPIRSTLEELLAINTKNVRGKDILTLANYLRQIDNYLQSDLDQNKKFKLKDIKKMLRKRYERLLDLKKDKQQWSEAYGLAFKIAIAISTLAVAILGIWVSLAGDSNILIGAGVVGILFVLLCLISVIHQCYLKYKLNFQINLEEPQNVQLGQNKNTGKGQNNPQVPPEVKKQVIFDSSNVQLQQDQNIGQGQAPQENNIKVISNQIKKKDPKIKKAKDMPANSMHITQG